MAQLDIGNLTKVNMERNSVHDQVYTTYTVFDNNGENIYRLIHMERRENPEKISQSFQFIRETASYVANLLIKEFELRLY